MLRSARRAGRLANAQLLDRWEYPTEARQMVDRLAAESASVEVLGWLAILAGRVESFGGAEVSARAAARAEQLAPRGG